MIKKLQKAMATVGLAALAGAGIFGIAYAASSTTGATLPQRAAETTVTASWEMNVGIDAITGTSSSSAITTSVTVGEALKKSSKGDTESITFEGTTYSLTAVGLPGNNTGTESLLEGSYFDFTITPADGVAYSPKNISFLAAAMGYGDGALAVSIGDKEYYRLVKIARSDKEPYNYSYSVDFSDVEFSTEPVTIRINLFHRNNQSDYGRRMVLGNVVVTGEVSGEQGDEDPDPAVDATFMMPGVHELSDATADKIQLDKMHLSGDSFGYVENGSTATFTDVYCSEAGTYKAVIPLDYSYGTGTLKIEVKDETGSVEASYNGVLTKNNSTYEPISFNLEGGVTKGYKTIVYTFNDPDHSFCANVKAPEWVKTGEYTGGDKEEVEVPAGWLSIPGSLTIDESQWSLSGLRIENPGANANIGYARDNCYGKVKFFCKEKGLYSGHFDFYWYQNPGDLELTVVDLETGRVEASTTYTITGVHDADILLMGLLTTGKKELTVTFHAVGGHTGFIANFHAPVFMKVGENYAQVSSVSIEGIAPTPYEGYDWNFNLPADYNAATITLKVEADNATVSAKCGDETLTVAENGTIEVATPASNGESVVELTISPVGEGVYFSQEVYKVRLFHLGDVTVKDLVIGKTSVTDEVLTALNSDDATAIVADNVYTALPAINVTFLDGSTTSANGSLDGTTATYTFTGKAGDKSKNFTVKVEGIHVYTATEIDETVNIVYDDALLENEVWSNGLYTLSPIGDGWGGSQFKFNMKNGRDFTWEVPSNVVVKQMVFKQLGDNYASGNVSSVTSEGAQVWLPTENGFTTGGENRYDLVVNFDGHKAGEPIRFSFADGSQPYAMFDFVVEKVLVKEPVTVKKTTIKTVNNHSAVQIDFSMEMQDVTATCNGVDITAEGGSAMMVFPVWNLPYNEVSHLMIEVGAAKDVYGNTNAETIDIAIEIGNEPVAIPVAEENFIEVTNAEEFIAAVNALNATNTSLTSPRTVIFFRNGTYDLGGKDDTSVANGIVILRANNISLIGESRDGVIIRGINNGISNPVLSTRNATGTYFQDLTIVNALDYGTNADKGQAVALYSGKKEVLVNVTLLGKQDTHVTGDQCYYYNCDIAGKVDFICGGGNNYFDRCNLLIESAGAKITAPNTTAAQKWGYVFQNCVVKAGTDGASKVNKQFALGRPWQNEPRAYFLNTIMEVQPNDGGWDGMSNLITHMYEYNSMDAGGKALDLSKRKNSSTSLNSYTPVLTDEEAVKFTVENVLGGTDSYHPLDEALCYVPEAPTTVEVVDGVLTWSAVEHAAGYAIYYKGSVLERVSECKFDTKTAAPSLQREETVNPHQDYAVRAINSVGGMGEISKAPILNGIDAVEMSADEDEAVYYNVQGIRVSEDYQGVVVKVAKDGTITKEIRK